MEHPWKKSHQEQKILLCDQNREFANVLQKVLSRSGYRSFLAYDLSEAHQLLNQIDFDLMLLGLNGRQIELTTLEPIRDLTEVVDVIVTMQFSEDRLKQNLILSGVKKVLAKPIKKDDLLSAISSSLKTKRADNKYSINGKEPASHEKDQTKTCG